MKQRPESIAELLTYMFTMTSSVFLPPPGRFCTQDLCLSQKVDKSTVSGQGILAKMEAGTLAKPPTKAEIAEKITNLTSGWMTR